MQLELLAPAKNKDIGIAAIDCGADAVYIAGPSFGARESAGNSFEEIEELCQYAHRFGARIYMVINTILYDDELEAARRQIYRAYEIGCDAIIVQDLSIVRMDLPPIALHASTQTNIRTPEQARFLESLGFTRLILARELSTAQIREIRKSVKSDIETFVHGALCVSYSGQCYLSEYLCSRSANRGSCIQACRSDYDLTDRNGKIILKNKPILSLKDFNLSEHMEELIDAGVISFKIEGRLKSVSYVKNIVRHYRKILDEILNRRPELNKSSFGHIEGGFSPNPDYTFNRGYTDFFIDARRGQWNSSTSTKSQGEKIGTVSRILSHDHRGCRFQVRYLKAETRLSNGDGLLILNGSTAPIGTRIETVEAQVIQTKSLPRLKEGAVIYRNSNLEFEKELERNMPTRQILAQVTLSIKKDQLLIRSEAENGARASITLENTFEAANRPELAAANIRKQLEKNAGEYHFQVTSLNAEELPFLPLSLLNGLRRDLAEQLREDYLLHREQESRLFPAEKPIAPAQKVRLNCSNHLSRELYREMGIDAPEAYELSHDENEELMRTKYCIRYELGYCPKEKGSRPSPELPFYLINNGKKLKVDFDCQKCEMVIKRG